MKKGTILYVPVSGSSLAQNPAEPAHYFGAVFRIPRSDYGTARQVEWEPTPNELLAEAPASAGAPAQRVLSRAIERVEVCDRDSGDIWVMYRVPYGV